MSNYESFIPGIFLPGEITRKARIAYIVSLIMFVAYVVVVPVYLYVAGQTATWQIYPLAGTTSILAILCALSAWLSRQERSNLGMGIIITASALFYPLTPLLVSGLGVVLGLSLLVAAPIIILSSVEGKAGRWLLFFSILSGLGTLLLEFYGPESRPVVVQLQAFVPLLATTVLLILSAILIWQFPNYSLRSKMIISFVAASIISLGIVVYLTNRATERLLIDNANQKLLAAATQTGSTLDTFITTNLIAIGTEAQLPALVQYLALDDVDRQDSQVQQDLVGYLDALSRKDSTYISSYALLDNVGISLIDTSMEEVGISKANRPYYLQPLLTGQPYVSPITYSPATGQPSLYFSAPVYNEHQALQGVLRVRYEARILQDMLAQHSSLAGAESFAVLFDENSIQLAHGTAPDTNYKAVGLLTEAEVAALQAARRLPEGTVSELSLGLPGLSEKLSTAVEQPFLVAQVFSAQDASVENRLNQAALTKLETQSWYVGFFQPRDVFLAPVGVQQRSAAVVAVIISALAITAAVGISHRLVRPIADLTQAAVRVAAGDLTAEAIVQSSDEIGILSSTFNSMTSQLRELVGALERRVADRTRDLALANEVGRRVSQLRDLDKLLAEAVEIIQSRFDLHYTQIYLSDAAERTLFLRSGTGAVGDQLVRSGHQLLIGPDSINGLAAIEKRAVIVSDTTSSAIFRPNQLLPDVRSEMAVPLLIGDRVVGVLDLQSDRVDALSSDNLPAFETLAGQLAVAIENANLFTEITAARTTMEAQARRLTRTGWDEFLNAIDRREHIGYAYDLREGVMPLSGSLSELQERSAALSAPISLAGEAIGSIYLEGDSEQTWTDEQLELVNSVAAQVAQQVENLRLLHEADRYRTEAEEASRRLTHEGWSSFQAGTLDLDGFVYDRERVFPLAMQPENGADDEFQLRHQLAVRGATIGELALDGTTNLDAEEVIAAVAGQLSTHIENLRLTEQTEQALNQAQRRNAELGSINRVVSAVTSSLDLKQSLETIAQELARSLAVEQIGIALLNEERTHVTVVAEYFDEHKSTSAIGVVFPLEGNELTQQVIETRQTIVVEDVASNPLTAPVREALLERNVYSLALLPIVAGNQVIGTLGIDILEEGRELSAADLQLAETIVFHAATAIQNVRLFEQTQQSLAETQALYQISAALNSAESFEDVLTVLREDTVAGQRAQVISLNYFDQTWTKEQKPEWVQTVAFWSAFPTTEGNIRRHLSDFPIADALLASDKPGLLADITGDPRLNEHERDLYARQLRGKSALFVPLVVGGQWVGFLNTVYKEQMKLSDLEVRRLMSIAGQAAVAAQSIRLLDDANRLLRSEQRQRRIADALVHAGGRISGIQSESEIKQIIVDEIYNLLRPDQIALYQWQAAEDAFRVSIRNLAAPGHDEDEFEVGQLLTAEERPDLWQVFSENKPLLTLLPQPDSFVREHYCLPLLTGNVVSDVVEVYHTARGASIRDEDQATCEGLIQQAALRLQNVRLLEAAQNRAEREQILREITARVRSSADVDTVMRTAVQEVGRALGRKTFVYLSEESQHTQTIAQKEG